MSPIPAGGLGFLTKYNGIARALFSDVAVLPAFSPALGIAPQYDRAYHCKGLWDTGANGTLITEHLVRSCGLQPTGVARAHTPNGVRDTHKYLIALGLPNKVMIPELEVVDGELDSPTGDCHVLIGMDVISQGDFVITNHNGETWHSFRIPSQEHISFVKTQPRRNVAGLAVGRNDPCPCGSGKKYKKCCGAGK